MEMCGASLAWEGGGQSAQPSPCIRTARRLRNKDRYTDLCYTLQLQLHLFLHAVHMSLGLSQSLLSAVQYNALKFIVIKDIVILKTILFP